MTATTSTPVRSRTKVGWGDLAWLTWRQHRLLIVIGVGLAALGSLTAVAVAWAVGSPGNSAAEFLTAHLQPRVAGQLLTMFPMAFGALVAVFWAAPLLASEYEQKTHFVAWGQDLSPARWLLGKVVLLGVSAIGLTAVSGAAVQHLLTAVNTHVGTRGTVTGHLPFPPFLLDSYESDPLVQVGFAAFGFALGLVVSALTRRTVVSMGIALGLFLLVRLLVAVVWRPRFWTPERLVTPIDDQGRAEFDVLYAKMDDSMPVGSGYLDGSGNEVELSRSCYETDFNQCLRESGVVSFFADHHPIDRLVPFQLFEFAVFAVLAAGLLALAFRLVRRSHRL
ncbi:hypothetical protein [Actinosynnema sp. NPDC023587]|uniref:hypothetical protein n=1 Tax=Actinosynnema sp. NPDC023587 TaxID=3154695 RepID=UPI0033E691E5